MKELVAPIHLNVCLQVDFHFLSLPYANTILDEVFNVAPLPKGAWEVWMIWASVLKELICSFTCGGLLFETFSFVVSPASSRPVLRMLSIYHRWFLSDLMTILLFLWFWWYFSWWSPLCLCCSNKYLRNGMLIRWVMADLNRRFGVCLLRDVFIILDSSYRV